MHNSPLSIHQTRSGIKELVRQLGACRAAAVLGLNRETVIRICAGVGVRRGSLLIAERAVQAHRAANKSAVST